MLSRRCSESKALESRGYLSADPARESAARIWSYIGQEKSPSRSISIRAIESEKYKVLDGKTDEILEEIEENRAFFQAYQMRSTKLQPCGTTALSNSCTVTTTWFGFRCICKRTNRILDTVDLVLPKYSYESQAVWIQVPTSIKSEVEKKGCSFRAGLHAASHSVLNVVPLVFWRLKICTSVNILVLLKLQEKRQSLSAPSMFLLLSHALQAYKLHFDFCSMTVACSLCNASSAP